MKNKRFLAVLMSVVMVLVACMSMSGMAVYAVENAQVLTEETVGEMEEEYVSPDHDEEAAENDEAADPKFQEEKEDADAHDEADTAEKNAEEGIPEVQEMIEETQYDQESGQNSEAAEENMKETS